MTDMDKLIEAVVAGTATMGSFARVFPSETAYGKTTWGTAHNAFSGSLDAAKALHDALLPGWVVKQIGQARIDGSGGWSVWLVAGDYLESCAQAEARASNPARAWLIAILKAYRAQVQK